MRTLGWTGLALVALTGQAHATYSIVATDSDSRQVGGAGTSCVGSLSVTIIYGSAPGVGAVHAQAFVNTAGRDRAVELLQMDTGPDDIIVAITDSSFDGMAARRQYGIVDLSGRAAGWTGSENGAYAEDRQGTVGTFVFSVQGNILTSAAVLDQAEAAFGGGCDLADNLMLALEAGADNGEGDSRCTPDGIPSDSAFLQVDPDGAAPGSWLLLDVTDTAPDSPLLMLRTEYDLWRADNPCPGSGANDAGPESDGGPSDGAPDGACGCRVGGAPGAGPPAVALVLLSAAGVVISIRRRR